MPYKIFVLLFVGVFLALFVSEKAIPYVMQSEQILYLMEKNFSGFKTLVITQATRVLNPYDQAGEALLNEKIWLKNTGEYRSELIGETYGGEGADDVTADREPGGDVRFRMLFLCNDPETLQTFLSRMGVDTESVALTRFEGTVAYRLGHKHPQRPHLVVDKETFLPIAFCYTLQTDFETTVVRVRFDDYQKTGRGWYPYDIIYSAGEVLEQSVTIDLQVNAPVDQPLSEIMIGKASPGNVDPVQESQEEDEQLKEMIELLKKKYQ